MEAPFSAYQGDEPYIFVCYAHDDAALVYPEITRLHEAGFHVWYDAGLFVFGQRAAERQWGVEFTLSNM